MFLLVILLVTCVMMVPNKMEGFKPPPINKSVKSVTELGKETIAAKVAAAKAAEAAKVAAEAAKKAAAKAPAQAQLQKPKK